MKSLTLIPGLLAAFLAGAGHPTREEALATSFGKQAVLTRTTHWLTAAQRKRAAELAGAEVRAVAELWTARDPAGALLGMGFVDARTVRTHGQTVLFAIGADEKLRGVSVLAFDEPRDYLPKEAWYSSFTGKVLNDELQLKRGVHAVTGATLTARATVAGAREALAVVKAVQEPPQP
ncbi:MAG: FMN-binding protein [Planctomycetota bacterium]|nr:FMN-binding protein [Planctomycetota bacterium]